VSSRDEILRRILRALGGVEEEEREEEVPRRRIKSKEMLRKERISTIHITITPSEKAILLQEFEKRKHLRTASDLVRNIIHEWKIMKDTLGDVTTMLMKMDRLSRKIDELNSKMDELIR